jgi:hypothetical protein
MDLAASTALSGKSSGRDETLGRPNVARSLGRFRVKSYLDRLAQVAQASISDLLKEAVEWRFLQVFHDGLKERRLALSAL